VKLLPYGQNRLENARRAGRLNLCEGESDALTLWHSGQPALGLPGAGATKALQQDHVEGIADVYLLPDNDKAGERFVDGVVDRLSELGFSGRLWRVIVPKPYKDVSEWYIARLLRKLIDPNTAPIRSEPHNERDLMIAAKASWVLSYDNLSSIPVWLSDALCRLSTGGGFSTRQIFTDEEEIIFDSQRSVILTSIEDVATREDLLERSLILYLLEIREAMRLEEKELWARFDAE